MNISPKVKRSIAIEVLILFSAVLLILLGYPVLWAINKFNLVKVENLQNQIKIRTHELDSIKVTFPKLLTFDEIIIGEVPIEYLISTSDAEIENSEKNIRQLYKLLSAFGYKFSDTKEIWKPKGWIPSEVFVKDIQREFTYNIDKMSELKKIYNFLKKEKCIVIELDEFVFCLKGKPPHPPYSSHLNYEKNKKQIDELKIELETAKSKVKSEDNKKEITNWIIITILALIYPFRFIFLLLLWSIKTVKQI